MVTPSTHPSLGYLTTLSRVTTLIARVRVNPSSLGRARDGRVLLITIDTGLIGHTFLCRDLQEYVGGIGYF